MKKVIFIVESPLYQRDFERFGIKYLMEKGYRVEVWRILPGAVIGFQATAKRYEGNNYYEYTSSEFQKKIQKHHDAIFVLIYSSNILYIKMYNILIRNGKKYIIMDRLWGIFLLDAESLGESFSLLSTWLRKVRTILRLGITQSVKRSYGLFIQLIYMQKYKNALRNNPPIQIITSTHSAAREYLADKDLKEFVLCTHALDYDRYIEENLRKDEDIRKYIVFCDSGFGAIDYDSVLGNYKQLNDKMRFSRQIESMLSKMEEKFNLPAIILGHPHTKYETDIIFGHKIVMGQTIEFTKKAAIFILNTSAAINFAILYNIPVLQVVNKEFKELDYFYPNLYKYIEYEARILLGCGFLDMDDDVAMEHPWDYVKRMDPIKRELYIHDYLIDNNTKDKCSYEYMEEAIRPYYYEEL